MTVTVGTRFRGPTTSGNGGYVAGLVAARLGHTGPVTVTLRTPPPLDVPMNVVARADGLALLDEDVKVAEAEPALEAGLTAVPPVSEPEARDVSTTYAGLRAHPFPQCFVCGPERAPDDGLRLFPGRLGDGRTACVWDVTPDVAGHAEFVWAALDCPGGWSAPIEGRPMVLGQLTAEVHDLPESGEPCVVMGLLEATEGRKTWTRTTAYGADGRVLGLARAVWIELPPKQPA